MSAVAFKATQCVESMLMCISQAKEEIDLSEGQTVMNWAKASHRKTSEEAPATIQERDDKG